MIRGEEYCDSLLRNHALRVFEFLMRIHPGEAPVEIKKEAGEAYICLNRLISLRYTRLLSTLESDLEGVARVMLLFKVKTEKKFGIHVVLPNAKLDELCDELLNHLSGDGSIHARYFAISCIGILVLQDRFIAAAFARVGASQRLRSLAILEQDQLLYDLIISAEHELRQAYSNIQSLVDPCWDIIGFGSYPEDVLEECMKCTNLPNDPVCGMFPRAEHYHVHRFWTGKRPTVSPNEGGVLVQSPSDARWLNVRPEEVFDIGKYLPRLNNSDINAAMDTKLVLVSTITVRSGDASTLLLVSKHLFEQRAELGMAASSPFSVLVSAW